MLRNIVAMCIGVSLLAACSNTATDARKADASTAAGRCDTVLDYDIDFDRFDETAQQIAHATGCFIEIENMTAIASVKPNPVKGRMTPREALSAAIKGTSLIITRNEPDLIGVEQR
ncbi:MAG TPA: hypothetical protein VD840_01595 [Sinorhizobium sp.]|nr:hypothetical protein [Sinorhizobium sp.]